MSTEVKSGGSLAWAIMACSLFSHLGTACLLYLYVINSIRSANIDFRRI